MFEKRKLNKQIAAYKKEIDLLEARRSRSQSALVQAILLHTDPDETDVEFFNKYTAQIGEVREKMHDVQKQLEALS